jgi:hypothetical protein
MVLIFISTSLPLSDSYYVHTMVIVSKQAYLGAEVFGVVNRQNPLTHNIRFLCSLRTTLCVRYKSEVVACGVVYAAARRHRVALPENPPWWEAFDAKKSDIDEVCRVLADLYQRPKARYIEVGKDVKSFVLTSRAWDPPPDVQVCAS